MIVSARKSETRTAIVSVIDGQDHARAEACRAAGRVRGLFSEEIVAEQLERLYASIVRRTSIGMLTAGAAS